MYVYTLSPHNLDRLLLYSHTEPIWWHRDPLSEIDGICRVLARNYTKLEEGRRCGNDTYQSKHKGYATLVTSSESGLSGSTEQLGTKSVSVIQYYTTTKVSIVKP